MTSDGAMTPLVVAGIAAAFAAGVALGGLYFLGLWYTVRRHTRLGRSTPWLLLSLAGRAALLLGGFYFVMAGSWQRLLACVAGFVVVRVILTRRLGPGKSATLAAREPSS